jgi:hypothetical protein
MNNLFHFIEGKTQLTTFLACQDEFDPQWTDTECSLLKPLHCLQACTKHHRTWKMFYAKPTPDKDKFIALDMLARDFE